MPWSRCLVLLLVTENAIYSQRIDIAFVAPNKATEKYWYFSDFFTKSYVVYSLEVPRRGAFNEYQQRMFSWRNKKNIMWIPPLIWSYPTLLSNWERITVDCTQLWLELGHNIRKNHSNSQLLHWENGPLGWKPHYLQVFKESVNVKMVIKMNYMMSVCDAFSVIDIR